MVIICNLLWSLLTSKQLPVARLYPDLAASKVLNLPAVSLRNTVTQNWTMFILFIRIIIHKTKAICRILVQGRTNFLRPLTQGANLFRVRDSWLLMKRYLMVHGSPIFTLKLIADLDL